MSAPRRTWRDGAIGTFVSNMLAVAFKETALMRRDKVLLGAIVAQPIMMLFLFGVVLSNRPANIPWGVIDRSHSAVSRRLIAEIQTSGYFLPVASVTSYQAARQGLHDGTLLAVVVIPQDFHREAISGQPDIQLLLDGTDPLSAARIGAYIRAIAARLDVHRDPDAVSGSPVALRSRFWFNPTLSDRRFLLASLGGMLLTNVCLSVSCLGLVLEREEGTYEQMLSLPTTTVELVLGKLLPSIALCYLVLSFAIVGPGLIFGVWPAGGLVALAIFTFPFVMATLGLGVLISTLVSTVAQAVFLSV
ncbi:MAG: ABC transporter permease, partial [Deltaproteobacteria bacterium]|nr:ABC transporter permease [Deltaproteobacteria bacterium]